MSGLMQSVFAMYRTFFLLVLVLSAQAQISQSSGLQIDPLQYGLHKITRRETASTSLQTCGYQDGDPDRPRSAELGFECRTDTEIGIWGFCATTVTSAANCGMAGACFDEHACSSGCGLTGYGTRVTTFSCNDSGPNSMCSTALLIPNRDQTYTYIDCGPSEVVLTYFVDPTTPLSGSSARATSSATSATSLSSGETPAAPATSGSRAPAETSGISAGSESTRETNGKSSGSTGTIAGSVIGGIAIICFTVVAIFIIRRRKRRSTADDGRTEGFSTYHQHLVPQYSDRPLLVEAGGRPIKLGAVGTTKPIELAGS